MYDPSTGQRLQRDPILYRGGDSNLYNYSVSDPINFVDHNGKGPEQVAVGVVGAIVGALSSLRNSSSCTLAGKAIDVTLGAATGFVAGYLAAVGIGTKGFVSNLIISVAGPVAGVAPSLVDVYAPSGDMLLGNKCGCPRK